MDRIIHHIVKLGHGRTVIEAWCKSECLHVASPTRLLQKIFEYAKIQNPLISYLPYSGFLTKDIFFEFSTKNSFTKAIKYYFFPPKIFYGKIPPNFLRKIFLRNNANPVDDM